MRQELGSADQQGSQTRGRESPSSPPYRPRRRPHLHRHPLPDDQDDGDIPRPHVVRDPAAAAIRCHTGARCRDDCAINVMMYVMGDEDSAVAAIIRS